MYVEFDSGVYYAAGTTITLTINNMVTPPNTKRLDHEFNAKIMTNRNHIEKDRNFGSECTADPATTASTAACADIPSYLIEKIAVQETAVSTDGIKNTGPSTIKGDFSSNQQEAIALGANPLNFRYSFKLSNDNMVNADTQLEILFSKDFRLNLHSFWEEGLNVNS